MSFQIKITERIPDSYSDFWYDPSIAKFKMLVNGIDIFQIKENQGKEKGNVRDFCTSTLELAVWLILSIENHLTEGWREPVHRDEDDIEILEQEYEEWRLWWMDHNVQGTSNGTAWPNATWFYEEKGQIHVKSEACTPEFNSTFSFINSCDELISKEEYVIGVYKFLKEVYEYSIQNPPKNRNQVYPGCDISVQEFKELWEEFQEDHREIIQNA